MHRILFVCFGNICRSPMAECIMKDLVRKRGLEGAFSIASRGTQDSEAGSPVYPAAKAELMKHGVGCAGKTAVKLRAEDYAQNDLLIAMDERNVRAILRITGGDSEGKVHRMMEHTVRGGEVDDPWVTGRFDVAYRDILEGCESWLNVLAPR